MKTIKLYATMLAALFVVESTVVASDASAQTVKRGWSKKGKGAAVGAGTGAVAGAVIAGKGDRATGALVGAGAGAVGGALIGRKRDKKTNRARYEQYSRKD